MTNIFIANLDWEITSEDLASTFSAFGEVHLAHVVFDAKTKKSKGFGYVEMVSAEEAINAIQALNGFEVNGRKLDVKIASPKANRPKPEDKPQQRPFGNKPGGFQKKFNNGPRPGGGGGYQGGGGYRSNDGNRSEGGYRPRPEGGGYRSNDGNRSEGGYRPRPEGGSGGYRSNDAGTPREGGFRPRTEGGDSPSGERQLRPRKRTDE